MNPIRLSDLALLSQVPALLNNEQLLTAFNNDEHVNIASNGLYSWKVRIGFYLRYLVLIIPHPQREYHARTPEELEHEIRVRGRDGGGLSIKQLKEGFPDVVTHIEELEKKGTVLVTRNPKDNSAKFVFWNEITEEQGGSRVDEGALYFPLCEDTLNFVVEFRALWSTLKTPVEADLVKALEKDGLQATLSEASPSKQPLKKKGKKPKATNRVGKITNTHIEGVDLTKDYVRPTTS